MLASVDFHSGSLWQGQIERRLQDGNCTPRVTEFKFFVLDTTSGVELGVIQSQLGS